MAETNERPQDINTPSAFTPQELEELNIVSGYQFTLAEGQRLVGYTTHQGKPQQIEVPPGTYKIETTIAVDGLMHIKSEEGHKYGDVSIAELISLGLQITRSAFHSGAITHLSKHLPPDNYGSTLDPQDRNN